MRHGWLCWARGAALLTELQLVLKLCVGRVREQFAARCHLRTISKVAQRRCLLCLLEEAVASAFVPLDSSGIGARQVGSCVIYLHKWVWTRDKAQDIDRGRPD